MSPPEEPLELCTIGSGEPPSRPYTFSTRRGRSPDFPMLGATPRRAGRSLRVHSTRLVQDEHAAGAERQADCVLFPTQTNGNGPGRRAETRGGLVGHARSSMAEIESKRIVDDFAVEIDVAITCSPMTCILVHPSAWRSNNLIFLHGIHVVLRYINDSIGIITCIGVRSWCSRFVAFSNTFAVRSPILTSLSGEPISSSARCPPCFHPIASHVVRILLSSGSSSRSQLGSLPEPTLILAPCVRPERPTSVLSSTGG